MQFQQDEAKSEEPKREKLTTLIVFVEIAHKPARVAVNDLSRSSSNVRARFVLSRFPWAGIS
jgi:hypothetical protein